MQIFDGPVSSSKQRSPCEKTSRSGRQEKEYCIIEGTIGRI